MRKKPDTLHRQMVARSRLFRVESVGLRFTNGVEVEYEPGQGYTGAQTTFNIVEGAVLVLAIALSRLDRNLSWG